ncbi:sulfotransferase family 2 domain-containing protein [Thalassomonas actiniarum]|uniref:Sulfotransferase family 2 domain-containing protein n=1 Tax=Thalassomonas actiniarum TaxID=485447 RepID=A0AAF0C3W0_9GAMM|nr:sulfotransferase family 2 domain-containing protein [Thalassomonas actiniarum]WDE01632.1 sulfotransferase family 2 domain-containing protein [Thalassomonas actiniarum]
MPHFYHAKQNLLISTSYKVMYSRLVAEKSLDLVTASFLPLALDNGADYYVIVRSPCSRLLSFFNDKFRRNIRNKQPGKRCWQDCQRLFFQVLALDLETNDHSKRQRFLQTSYREFIDFLPEVYQRDVHLQPQCYLLDEIASALKSQSITAKLLNPGEQVQSTRLSLSEVMPYQLVHLESGSETAVFARRSGINLDRKVNATQTLPLDEADINKSVDSGLWQKIYQLYRTDFNLLGYAQSLGKGDIGCSR